MTETRKPVRPGTYSRPQPTDKSVEKEMDDVETVLPATGPTTPPLTEEKNEAPTKAWTELIEEVGLTEARANAILNEIATKGYWEKKYVIWDGLVKVSLRTRDSYNLERVNHALDVLRNPTPNSVSQTIFRMNLAGSISRFQSGEVAAIALAHPAPTAEFDEIENLFQKRLNYVDKIAGPILPRLYEALSNFDKVVSAVLAKGSVEGF